MKNYPKPQLFKPSENEIANAAQRLVKESNPEILHKKIDSAVERITMLEKHIGILLSGLDLYDEHTELLIEKGNPGLLITLGDISYTTQTFEIVKETLNQIKSNS